MRQAIHSLFMDLALVDIAYGTYVADIVNRVGVPYELTMSFIQYAAKYYVGRKNIPVTCQRVYISWAFNDNVLGMCTIFKVDAIYYTEGQCKLAFRFA